MRTSCCCRGGRIGALDVDRYRRLVADRALVVQNRIAERVGAHEVHARRVGDRALGFDVNGSLSRRVDDCDRVVDEPAVDIEIDSSAVIHRQVNSQGQSFDGGNRIGLRMRRVVDRENVDVHLCLAAGTIVILNRIGEHILAKEILSRRVKVNAIGQGREVTVRRGNDNRSQRRDQAAIGIRIGWAAIGHEYRKREWCVFGRFQEIVECLWRLVDDDGDRCGVAAGPVIIGDRVHERITAMDSRWSACTRKHRCRPAATSHQTVTQGCQSGRCPANRPRRSRHRHRGRTRRRSSGASPAAL